MRPTPHRPIAGADHGQIIWPDFASIRFKLRSRNIGRLAEVAVADGDWDHERVPVAHTVKYQSVIERYRYGVAWEDTDLFRSYYAPRLAAGVSCRGCRSLGELGDAYRDHIDPVYASIRRHGFVVPKTQNGRWLSAHPTVFIGRDGELLFGPNGNHRLAMAFLAGVEVIPCRALTRHAAWRRRRDEIARLPRYARAFALGRKLTRHPDMADLI